MKSLAFSTAALALVSCQSIGEPSGTSSQALDDIPGFTMSQRTSSFYLGTLQQTVVAQNLTRQVGTFGVFASYTPTGGTYAVSNADSPVWTFAPAAASTQAHASAVQSYFLAHGLPPNQILRASGLTEVEGGEDLGTSPTGSITRYIGVVHRAVNGVPVRDSHAAASLVTAPASGASVAAYERVYWPGFSHVITDSAAAFQAMLADPAQRATYLANLPTQNKDGTLVIRHSSWRQSPFVIFVAYDVLDGQTVRHFDQNATEEFLPSETQPLQDSTPFPFDGG